MILCFGKTTNNRGIMKEYIYLLEYKKWRGLEFGNSGDKELF